MDKPETDPRFPVTGIGVGVGVCARACKVPILVRNIARSLTILRIYFLPEQAREYHVGITALDRVS
jgi:hypothetical protein